ncbi:vitelline membrane protein 15a-3-like [Aedes aegypti]|uniref:Uncharacterized protein n=1 Tax=Aedes aegypti TaxID=7159 RepID=A0A6I8U088_AEDAE|nr:vitelline membrane protein 15a-3-like [Aedes aegypti]
MNKLIILALFAVAAASAMPNYPPPPPKPYHAPPPPPHHAHPPPPPPPAHYGHHAHPAPVVHTYPVHAPHAKCGANLLVGCAPSVAHVPCLPVHGHGHGYAPAPHYRAPESGSFDQFEE